MSAGGEKEVGLLSPQLAISSELAEKTLEAVKLQLSANVTGSFWMNCATRFSTMMLCCLLPAV